MANRVVVPPFSEYSLNPWSTDTAIRRNSARKFQIVHFGQLVRIVAGLVYGEFYILRFSVAWEMAVALSATVRVHDLCSLVGDRQT